MTPSATTPIRLLFLIAVAIFASGFSVLCSLYSWKFLFLLALVLPVLLIIALIVVKPLYGVCVLIVASGLDTMLALSLGSGAMKVTRILFFFVIGAFVLKHWLWKRSFTRVPGSLWIWAFLGYAALSLIWLPVRYDGLVQLGRLTGNVLLIYITASAIRSRCDLKVLMFAFAICGIVPAMIQLVNVLRGGFQIAVFTAAFGGLERQAGIFSHPNYLALFLLTPLIVVVSILLHGRVKRRTVIGLTLVMFLYIGAIITTFLRASWMAMGVVITVLFVFARNKTIASRLLLVGILGLFVLAISTPLVGFAVDRGLSFLSAGSDKAVGIRTQMIEQATPILWESGFIGVGWQGFHSAYRTRISYGSTARYETPSTFIPHNLILRFIVELGLTGLILYAGFLYKNTRIAVLWLTRLPPGSAEHTALLAMVMSLLSLYIVFMADPTIFMNNHWILFGGIAAVPAVSAQATVRLLHDE
jgi:O-antigen ligase